MKTCIVTTTYLVPEDRYKKTKKFLAYYLKKTDYDIIVLDNCSPIEVLQEFRKDLDPRVKVLSFDVHYDRPSHLDYKYLWRAVWYIKWIMDKDQPLGAYEKVIYMDNDFFVLSDRMFQYLKDIKEGWTTFWSKMHNFPETGCHIITNTCKEYKKFVSLSNEEFINTYNGQTMENVLLCTHVENFFVGDRYGESESPPESFEGLDYWAQMKTETIV